MLYSEGDVSDMVYLILSGMIVLHNKEKGALAVLTFKNTCGEETYFEAHRTVFENAYAHQKSFLL